MNADTLQAEGWAPFSTPGLTATVGPMWTRGEGPAREIGIAVDERHTNHIGNAHGGLLMTLADNALGYAVMEAAGTLATATVQLNIHFVAAAKIGDFIICRPEIVHRAKTLVFLRGLLTVASVDGVWKLLEPKRS